MFVYRTFINICRNKIVFCQTSKKSISFILVDLFHEIRFVKKKGIKSESFLPLSLYSLTISIRHILRAKFPRELHIYMYQTIDIHKCGFV
jgi:hypothetical protein